MMEISIDWLQFTLKSENLIYVIHDILKLNMTDFIELNGGKLGYQRQLFKEGISVLFEGGNKKEGEEMGVHVIITGKGCRIYEDFRPLLDLIEDLSMADSKITRIDLAMDDKEGTTILLERIIKDVYAGNIVSRWRTGVELTKLDLQEAKKIGSTLNLGSRTSDVFLRIYNKSMQLKIPGNWIRMELEIKGKRAVELQKLLREHNAGMLYGQIINNYIRIVKPGKDKNKSRWKNRKYWDKIITETERIQLSVIKETRTLEDMKHWITKQASATIATIILAEGGCVDFLYDTIKEGQKKLKDKHNQIIVNENKRLEDENV